jgi:hypothetical protein
MAKRIGTSRGFCVAASAIWASCLATSTAYALEVLPEEDPLAVHADKLEEEQKKGKKEPKYGWTVELDLGATFSFANNSNVVGVDNGSTIQFGGILETDANLNHREGHIWESRLTFEHTQTKTPQLDEFIKAVDNLELKSWYGYRIPSLRWMGPYARFRFQTQVLNGYSVKTDPTTVIRTRVDGTSTTETVAAQTRIALTSAFEPINVRESAGVFAIPVEKPEFTLRTKLGFGGQHIFADGGFVPSDDKDTPEFEVVEIETTSEAGAEAEVELSGMAVQEVINWSFSANVFYPVASSSVVDLSAGEKVNVDLMAKLSAKVNSWMQFEYRLAVRRFPRIVDALQVQNSLVLALSFSLV